MELTPDVVRLILEKFCDTEHVQALYDCLDRNETPYDAYLLQCDRVSCAQCRYRENCAYTFIKNMIRNAGAVYKDFHQQLQAE